MKRQVMGIKNKFAYADYNIIEISIQSKLTHDSIEEYKCQATDPKRFLKLAKSVLSPNSIMHLKAQFGVEYSTDLRNQEVDEQNCCIHLAFDVHEDKAINIARLEAFAKLTQQAIDLVHLAPKKR